MVMSNMKTNRNNAKATGTSSANKSNKQRQKLHQEEFGAEFDSAQVNNFAETQGKTDIKQPVSERTAWH